MLHVTNLLIFFIYEDTALTASLSNMFVWLNNRKQSSVDLIPPVQKIQVFIIIFISYETLFVSISPLFVFLEVQKIAYSKDS